MMHGNTKSKSRWKSRICTYTVIILCIVFLYISFCDLKMSHSGRNMSSSAQQIGYKTVVLWRTVPPPYRWKEQQHHQDREEQVLNDLNDDYYYDDDDDDDDDVAWCKNIRKTSVNMYEKLLTVCCVNSRHMFPTHNLHRRQQITHLSGRAHF